MKVKYNLYKNKRCFIVGTGKSLDNIDVSLLKDEITIATLQNDKKDEENQEKTGEN